MANALGSANRRATPEGQRAVRRRAALERLISPDDIAKMDAQHWTELYATEAEAKAEDNGAFGVVQSNVSRSQRSHIVAWMSEACAVLGWTAQTFFTAVHALDRYISSVDHQIMSTDLGPLATGCLYFGAQLIESATDENVYTLEKFRALCPEVGQGHVVREGQAHLLDTLQGISLSRKTPRDFLLLYLAELRCGSNRRVRELFNALLSESAALTTVFDLCSVLSLAAYTSGLCLDVVGSRLVACGVIRGVELCAAAAGEALPADLLATLCTEVFHLKGGAPSLLPYLAAAEGLTSDAARLTLANAAVLAVSSSKASASGSPQLPTADAFELSRHVHPENFSEWSVGAYCESVVELGERLRKLELAAEEGTRCGDGGGENSHDIAAARQSV